MAGKDLNPGISVSYLLTQPRYQPVQTETTQNLTPFPPSSCQCHLLLALTIFTSRTLTATTLAWLQGAAPPLTCPLPCTHLCSTQCLHWGQPSPCDPFPAGSASRSFALLLHLFLCGLSYAPLVHTHLSIMRPNRLQMESRSHISPLNLPLHPGCDGSITSLHSTHSGMMNVAHSAAAALELRRLTDP